MLFTASIIVGLALTTLGHATYQARQLADENVERALREAGQRFDAYLVDEAARLRPGLQVLGNDPTFVADVQTGDPEAARGLLSERAAALMADALLATDAQGTLVATSTSTPVGIVAPVASLVKQVLFDGAVAPAFGAVSVGGRVYTAAAAPLRFSGRPVGTIVAARLVSAEALGRATQSHAEVLRGSLRPGAFDERHHGERMRGTVRHLLSATGEVVASVRLVRSLDAELAPFVRFRLSLLAAAVSVMAVALVLASLAARRITEPLATLTRLAERIGEGSWPGEAPESSPDEIGALGQAFNRMRAGIVLREEQIRRLALQDPLTLLPNRALFADRLAVALADARRSGRPLAVLLMDLDHFKDINDTLGHHAGDGVLREVAGRLSACLRAGDTIARAGGDEFTLLLPGADASAARGTARALLAVLEGGVVTEEGVFKVKGSVGIAAFPEHGVDGSTLIRHADLAMYFAKRRGGGDARVFEPSLADESRARLFLLDDLQRAVSHEELVLHYQPKLDIASGEVHSVEALLRWNHPTRGLLGPAEFVPLAERSGFVRDLTDWVIDAAVGQCGRWLGGSMPLDIAINVSARDLDGGRLEGSLAAALERHGVPPERLCVEITESAAMEDPAQGQAIIARLRGLGLRVSLDDFGTGHSSLAYLSQLQVSELKIDRSFVQGLSRNRASDLAIARLIVDLGHALGVAVVAEGVEDRAACERLAAMGCDQVQGYLLSKPLPADRLAAWLAPLEPGAGELLGACGLAAPRGSGRVGGTRRYAPRGRGTPVGAG